MSDIREALESAMKGSDEASGDSGIPEQQPAPTQEAAQANEPAPSSEPDSAGVADKRSASERARDPSGRFTKGSAPVEGKTQTVTPAAVATKAVADPALKPDPVAPTETYKPPQSWKPTAREKWTTLPPEVQAEVARVDGEVRRVMQESAQAKRLAQEFNQVVSPYLGMIQAEGSTPTQAVQNLLQTAAALRTAPPAHKAQLVAGLIKTYGIPVEALADALDGDQAGQAQQQPQQFRDPRFDQFMSQVQQREQQRLQAEYARQAQEIESFATEHEFLDDVREDMADLMEVASKRGVVMSLKDAYNRAVAMNPELTKVIQQRTQAQAATTAQAATQAAKAAAASVKSQPAGSGPVKQADDLRSILEARWDAASGR